MEVADQMDFAQLLISIIRKGVTERPSPVPEDSPRGEIVSGARISRDPPKDPGEVLQLANSIVENFRAYALKQNGELISWGHNETKHLLPEKRRFLAIEDLWDGVFVLTDQGEVYSCTAKGTVPFAPEKGPFNAILTDNGGRMKAARKEDGSWHASGPISQAKVITSINSAGPIGTLGLSAGLVMWTIPPSTE